MGQNQITADLLICMHDKSFMRFNFLTLSKFVRQMSGQYFEKLALSALHRTV